MLNNSGSLQQQETSAKTINHLGSCQFEEGNYDLALEYFSKSLELTPFENKDGLARVHNNIGLCLTEKKNYREALRHFQQSLVLKRDGDFVSMDSLARTLGNMANCYVKLGEVQNALMCHIDCLNAKKQFHGIDQNEDIASSYFNIGQCHKIMGKEAEAEKNFDIALGIRMAVHGKVHLSVAHTMLAKAKVMTDIEHRLALLREAFQIAQKCSNGRSLMLKIRAVLINPRPSMIQSVAIENPLKVAKENNRNTVSNTKKIRRKLSLFKIPTFK